MHAAHFGRFSKDHEPQGCDGMKIAAFCMKGQRCMRARTKTSSKPELKWTTKKPTKQGRFWWTEGKNQTPTLVYVERQSLGLYVVGVGWLPYQPGQWAGPLAEDASSGNN